MITKTCKKCHINKPIEDFPVARKAGKNNFRGLDQDQISHTCKSCKAKEAKEYRDARPGLWKKYRKGIGKQKTYSSEDSLLISAIRTRITEAKARTKKHNLPTMTIDLDYMLNLYRQSQGTCAYSGIKLSAQKKTPETLSIDKIQPELGYVKGNVQWVAWAINRAKGDMQEYTFIDMCNKVVEKCNDYRNESCDSE